MRVSGTAVRRGVVAAVVVLTVPTGVATGVGGAAAAPPVGEAPFISNLVDSSTRVRVAYKDRSHAEDAFTLFRRGLTGSWEYVVEAPTRDKASARFQGELVDPAPNALRCYAVIAYDNAGGVLLQSRSECVDGVADPFDTSRTELPAPRVSSVQGQWSPTGIQVRINYADRSLTESRFVLVRRQDGTETTVAEAATASRTSAGQYRAFFDVLPPGGNACYTVRAVDDVTGAGNHSNEVCLTPPAALPVPPAGSGSVERVHSGPKPNVSFTGQTSVAIGADGLPVIAFKGRVPGSGKQKLLVAHCDDRACSSSTVTALDDEVLRPSIAIGRDGLPVVSYRSFAHGLRVAHCANRTCTSATFATVDDVGFFDLQTLAMTIGPDGLPLIAYEDSLRRTDGPDTATKVASCLDPGCSRATVTTIGTAGHSPVGVVPQYLAIATSSRTRRTYVAYLDGEPVFSAGRRTVLKVAACLDPACATRSTSTIARQDDGGHLPGTGLSMAVGRDGLPLLSYDRDTGLVVAHCVNVHCSGVTTKFYDYLAEGRDTVSNTSIAIGADGLGVVGYHNPWSSRIEVVRCLDLACGNASVRAIRTETAVDWAPSIAIGTDGLPVFGVGADVLSFFHCRDDACSQDPYGPPRTPGPIRGGGRCAEVLLASTDNGTPIQLRPCSGHVAQNWTVGADGTLRALGKCLTIGGAATADGTPIQLHDCNGLRTQVWESHADGTVRNPASGTCLDTASHSNVDFVRLVLWRCDPGIPSQTWVLPTA